MDTKSFSVLRRASVAVGGIAAAVLLSACGTISECDKGTAIGAGVGGVAGSVLTRGSTAGTVGGAVVGGVIGNRARC
jgi:osmotically inducible lipoprotein OsmB